MVLLWAYYELGWGGWWFWDPVENASFMPWLLGTALLHSLIIVEKRKSLTGLGITIVNTCFSLKCGWNISCKIRHINQRSYFCFRPHLEEYIFLYLLHCWDGYSLILFGAKSKKYFDNNYLLFLVKKVQYL